MAITQNSTSIGAGLSTTHTSKTLIQQEVIAPIAVDGKSGALGPLALSSDGKQLALGWTDHVLRIIELPHTHKPTQFKSKRTSDEGLVERCQTNLVFSPDGKYVLTGSTFICDINQSIDNFEKGEYTNQAHLWDARSGEEVRTFSGHMDKVQAVSFSPDGLKVVTGSLDHSARIWDATTGKQLHKLVGHEDMVYDTAFSPNGMHIATGGADGAIVFDAESGQLVWRLPTRNSIRSLSFSSDSRLLVVCDAVKSVQVWDLKTREVVFEMPEPLGTPFSAAFTSDSERLVVAGRERHYANDGGVKSWPEIQIFKWPVGDLEFEMVLDGWLMFMITTPDANNIITVEDEGVKLWEYTYKD